MTIYPVVWVILGGVLLAIIVFGALANLMDAGAGLWARLASRYPAQPEELDAERGQGQIYLATKEQWTKLQQRRGCLSTLLLIPVWPLLFWRYRPSWYNTRYTLGADYLHLELAQGRLGATRPMSIPWAALEPLHQGSGHLGHQATFAIDELVLQAPIRMLERELSIRTAAAESMPPEIVPRDDSDAGFGIDAPPKRPRPGDP